MTVWGCARRLILAAAALALAACSNGRGSVEETGEQTSPEGFSVGGVVSGLAGEGLALQLNGGAELPITADGPFTFPSTLADGAEYDVAVRSQPAGQTCTVSNGAGRVAGAHVSNVAIVCASGAAAFTVGGEVSGLTGSGLVLRNNDSEDLPIGADGQFLFPTPVATGAAYHVTVAAQPANPAQTCSVDDGAGVMGESDVTSVRVICSTAAFTVGGVVTGLRALGLRLKNNDEILAIGADGPFTFPSAIASGAGYQVSVETQPSGQSCIVANGDGAIEDAPVTDVAVTCASNVYTVGGTVSGLAPGARLSLRLTVAGEHTDETISRNGPFTFDAHLTDGAGYIVEVRAQPSSPAQECVVANGAGIIDGASPTNVAVTCTTRQFTIGGVVQGLQGSGLTLRLNGAGDLPIASDGNFIFATPLRSGASYEVTAAAQPTSPPQTCTVQRGTGTVGDADVRNIAVVCALNEYSIGGTVSGLLGRGLALENNGGDAIQIESDGAFTFPQPVATGGAYNVTVRTAPSEPTQACVVSNGAGVVGAAAVTNVAVNCTTSSFTIGGAVSGLEGSGLVLRNNGGDDLAVSANGQFTFAAPIASGAAYNVTVAAQPTGPAQICTVAGGTGVVAADNVASVQISCETTEFTIGGSTSGLEGSGLALQNNGADDLPIASNGPFQFSGSLTTGEPYAVTVRSQPTNPSQTCSVANGSGVVANEDIVNVAVNCVTDTFTVGGVVTGLQGFGFSLRLNGGEPFSPSNGPFTFPTPVASGSTYQVTVAAQPVFPFQTCTVTNGAGTIGAANVTDVAVTCQ